MSILLTLTILWISLFIYKRYVPVFGLKKVDFRYDLNCTNKNIVFVDTRDFQTSFKNPVEPAFRLPLPYLNRHYKEINGKHVVLIVTDDIEKNLSARILQKKGIKVIGYYMPKIEREEDCLYEI